MGIVYAACDPALDRKVAVKVLQAATEKSDETSTARWTMYACSGRDRSATNDHRASDTDASSRARGPPLMSEHSVFGDQLPARSCHVGKGAAKAKGSDDLPNSTEESSGHPAKHAASEVMVRPCHALVAASSTWFATTRDHSRMNQLASTVNAERLHGCIPFCFENLAHWPLSIEPDGGLRCARALGRAWTAGCGIGRWRWPRCRDGASGVESSRSALHLHADPGQPDNTKDGRASLAMVEELAHWARRAVERAAEVVPKDPRAHSGPRVRVSAADVMAWLLNHEREVRVAEEPVQLGRCGDPALLAL